MGESQGETGRAESTAQVISGQLADAIEPFIKLPGAQPVEMLICVARLDGRNDRYFVMPERQSSIFCEDVRNRRAG